MSDPLKLIVTVGVFTSPAGAPVMTVSGGVLSTRTTHIALAGLPASSVAVAVRVWGPSANAVVVQGGVAVTLGAAGGTDSHPHRP